MGRPDTLCFTGVICIDARDLQDLVLGSPATRTNYEWIQRPMDLPCCDDVQGMQPTRERGRLARIRPGTMDTNPAKASSASLARDWPWTKGCLQRKRRGRDPPRLRFGRDHGAPAGGVAGCYIAGNLSGSLRQCMRAGRPRSRVGCLFPSLLLLEGIRSVMAFRRSVYFSFGAGEVRFGPSNPSSCLILLILSIHVSILIGLATPVAAARMKSL